MTVDTKPSSRTRSRSVVGLDARLESGCVRGAGIVLSLSEGGLFVATLLAFPVGARVVIVLDSPDGSPIRVPGQVIYHATLEGRAGMGLRLLGTPGLARAVRSWIPSSPP